MDERVKSAARRLIGQLAGRASAGSSMEEIDPALLENGLAQLAVAQIALHYPDASIGTCVSDGSALAFEGREDGLYVCCVGDENHAWKIG